MTACATLSLQNDRRTRTDKPRKKLTNPIAVFAQAFLSGGGRGGIRTHDRLAPMPVFKTGALNHSATLPSLQVLTDTSCEYIRATLAALDPTWTHHSSTPFDRAPITSAIEVSAFRVGGLRFHDLRGTHETHLLDKGMSVAAVAARCGHDPAVMLRSYANGFGLEYRPSIFQCAVSF